ncbi:hypothetical protein FKM82_026261 [Ascaphus truei]
MWDRGMQAAAEGRVGVRHEITGSQAWPEVEPNLQCRPPGPHIHWTRADHPQKKKTLSSHAETANGGISMDTIALCYNACTLLNWI